MLSIEEIQSSNNELYIFLTSNPTDYHGDLTLILQKKYRLHNLQEGWVENLSLPIIATALNKVTHVDFLICHFPEIIAQHGKDMIIAAARTGHLEILQKLINLGENLRDTHKKAVLLMLAFLQLKKDIYMLLIIY